MTESLIQKRFRWRIIPGWILLLCGWLLTVLSCFLLIARVVISILGWETTSGWTFLGIGISVISGFFWIRSGRAFFDGRWKAAAANLLLGYVAGASGSFLSADEILRTERRKISWHQKSVEGSLC